MHASIPCRTPSTNAACTAATLVAMLLVVFFMLDRLNDLHRKAGLPAGVPDSAEAFGGLSGKNLWDAMIGVPSPGWSQKKLAELRPRYELVLQKHMELLFEDGKFDGKEGFSAPVRSDRMVTTLRGEVESWIPHEFASGLYNAGFQLVATPVGSPRKATLATLMPTSSPIRCQRLYSVK